MSETRTLTKPPVQASRTHDYLYGKYKVTKYGTYGTISVSFSFSPISAKVLFYDYLVFNKRFFNLIFL